MKGCSNQDNKVTDLYLPRKCDYTDRLITPKDNSSVQITICDVPFCLNSGQCRRNHQFGKEQHPDYQWVCPIIRGIKHSHLKNPSRKKYSMIYCIFL